MRPSLLAATSSAHHFCVSLIKNGGGAKGDENFNLKTSVGAAAGVSFFTVSSASPEHPSINDIATIENNQNKIIFLVLLIKFSPITFDFVRIRHEQCERSIYTII